MIYLQTQEGGGIGFFVKEDDREFVVDCVLRGETFRVSLSPERALFLGQALVNDAGAILQRQQVEAAKREFEGEE